MSEFDLLITDANLFTADPESPYIKSAAIVINDGNIQWLGKHSDLPEYYRSGYKKHIIQPDGWLTPGLIDCHTHLVYAGNRSDEFRRQLHGESYQSIAQSGGGILSTVHATRKASEAELYEQSAKRLHSWLRQGVTHIEIKSGYGLSLASEMAMLKVASRLKDDFPIDVSRTLLAAHSLPPEFTDADEYITHICETLLPQCHDLGLVDAVDGFCEQIAFNTSQIEKLFTKARDLGVSVKLHAEQLSNQGGSQLAAKMGALSVDHLEYLDEPAIKAMSQHDTVAVLLPAAFYFLKESQLPPIELLRDYKVPMAVATDHNPGSAPTMSLPLMINMSCRLFGLLPEEALYGVTSHAAKALGIEHKKGSLMVGKQADIVCWPVDSLTDLAYYFGNHQPEWIIQDGKLSPCLYSSAPK